VRHLSARPAAAFGLAGRGILAPGMAADVVVFDPDTVAAGRLERVHDFPAEADRLISRATGIDAVIVNGTTIRQGGDDRVDATGPLPGTVLRSTRQVASSAAS
jgi:N-acyl-D-aspartate/D-glutamate deacylase